MKKTQRNQSKKTRAFRFLWILDPWETLDHPRDTSLRLAEEALTLGHENHLCDLRSIRLENGEIHLTTLRLETVYPGRLKTSFKLGAELTSRPGDFHSIQYRVDPPVDLHYLHPLQLLLLAGKLPIVNPPDVLFTANEKLEAHWLAGLMPPSIAAARWEDLEPFGRREGRAVLKPLHLAQSRGIELLDFTAKLGKAKETLSQATEDFSRPVLLQKYLPGVADGEQRLWFLDGKLLAFCKKMPLQGDFRVNIDQGSRLMASELSAADKRASKEISKRLRARKIRLAAVDLIESKVTDFNFTSPGLISQMETLLDKNLAANIIRALASSGK